MSLHTGHKATLGCHSPSSAVPKDSRKPRAATIATKLTDAFILAPSSCVLRDSSTDKTPR